MMKVVSLHRYPVKGLSPEPLAHAELERGRHFPGDRLFAIENGPSGYDAAAPRHQPKIKFLMLMRDEALARLRTRYDDATKTLRIECDGESAVDADMSMPDGRAAIEALMRRFVPRALRGPPKVLGASDGHRFTDSRSGFVSIINSASVQAVEEMVGRPVDPLRFRGNLLVDGLAPWAEFDLVGRDLSAIFGVRLRVTKRIVRCAATSVDPTTAERDLDIPATLMRRLGHADCGVYAEIVAGGPIAVGDRLSVELVAQPELDLAAPAA